VRRMPENPTPQEISEKAQRAYQAGDFSAAMRAYAEAADAYTDQGDRLNSAEMKNNQCVALLRNKQPALALEVVKDTAEVFAEAGDSRRQGMALANQASALEALKQYKDSLACYQQAGDVLAKADEGDLRAEVMQLLAALYLRRGKILDAIVALQSGLAGVKNPTPKQRLMKKFLFIRL